MPLNSALNAMFPLSPTVTTQNLGDAPCFFQRAAAELRLSVSLAWVVPGAALKTICSVTAMVNLLNRFRRWIWNKRAKQVRSCSNIRSTNLIFTEAELRDRTPEYLSAQGMIWGSDSAVK